MSSDFKINPTTVGLTWQIIFDRVKLGYELQEIKLDTLSKEQILKYNDAIIISPDYQREYRFSASDESSLIESALLGIPVPPIFLASYKYKGVQILNVVDGQHRLRAFYRYFSGLFRLTDLNILNDHNGKKFDDLEIEDMTSLQTSDISTITFRDFPGKEFELEIFNRYNKGTKPLTPQEIRHAVFDSKVNELVNDFCKDLIADHKTAIAKSYAISKDRYQKKTCQENIFVILSILEYGVIQSNRSKDGKEQKLFKSPQFAETYMEKKSVLEKNDETEADTNLKITSNLFEKFNKFVVALSEVIEFPFSKEIYGVSKRGNKFQVSISMILAGIFNKFSKEGFDLDTLSNNDTVKRFAQKISKVLNNSYLEDPMYNASTTNPVEIQKIVDSFEFEVQQVASPE